VTPQLDCTPYKTTEPFVGDVLGHDLAPNLSSQFSQLSSRGIGSPTSTLRTERPKSLQFLDWATRCEASKLPWLGMAITV